MGKLRVRYRHQNSGATLAVSVERMPDGAQYNFTAGSFQPAVADKDALTALQERLPEVYSGQSRYKKLYCLDKPIDSAVWQDAEYMICIHDVSPGTDLEALTPVPVAIRNGDDSAVATSGNFQADLLLY